VLCHDCDSENASMNIVCAYCGVQLRDRQARAPGDWLFTGRRKWLVFAATMLLPIVGVITGLAYLRSSNEVRRSMGRFWLLSGVCASALYGLACGIAWMK
jgi:hypothetical protein